MPEPYPLLSPSERMFVHDLTLYDELQEWFDKLHALANSAEDLIEAPYPDIAMTHARTLVHCIIDYVEAAEWSVDDWWKQRQKDAKPCIVVEEGSHHG
jgi:hypothetical protein